MYPYLLKLHMCIHPHAYMFCFVCVDMFVCVCTHVCSYVPMSPLVGSIYAPMMVFVLIMFVRGLCECLYLFLARALDPLFNNHNRFHTCDPVHTIAMGEGQGRPTKRWHCQLNRRECHSQIGPTYCNQIPCTCSHVLPCALRAD